MRAMASIAVVLVLTASATGWAQTANSAPGESPVLPGLNATPAHIPVGSRVGQQPSGYDDGGRRDPFASLVVSKRTTTPSQTPSGRPRTGLASMALADVTVSGITVNGTLKLAVLEGPNKRSYVVHVKDQLSDAVVTRIDSDAVVFTEVNEPGVPATQVRRPLRSSGEDVR